MKTRVQRWGNSLAVRIPKPLADEFGLTDNSPVQLSLTIGTWWSCRCSNPLSAWKRS